MKFFLFFLLILTTGQSQVLLIELGIGSHNNYIGVSLYFNTKLVENTYFQVNARSRFYFTGIGPLKPYGELVISPKFLYLFGKDYVSFPYYEWLGIKENEVFVKYNFFIDTRKTTQTTGTYSFRIKKFAFAIDNDAFAFTGEDKYRTGAFGFFLLDTNRMYSIKYVSFTGDPKGIPTNPPTENYKREYKDLSKAPYGKYSNGIILLETAFNYLQFPYLRIGADYEKFRHFFQNKLVHDAPGMRKRNVHYPMLDIHGKPYLSKKQKLKPLKFYYELGTNSYLFY